MVYENQIQKGYTLRIAVGALLVFLVFMGGAGASIQLINMADEIGDVSNVNGSVNHPDIDIVRVTISKDSDVYTSQIIVNGNIDTTNAQYSITMNDGVKDKYLIMVNYNVYGSDSGIWENTSTLHENTSSWLYNKTRDVQVSANGNTLNIVADFSGIDLTGYTFLEAGAYLLSSDYMTLLEWDMIDLTATPTPNSAVTITVSPSMENLIIGGTQAFKATPKDQNGNPVSVEVTWASSNTTVGTINSNGLFTALANGTTTVTATADSIIGSTTIRVGVN